MRDIINDFAGHVLVIGLIWYAAEQALAEWRDWAIRKSRERHFNSTPN